MESPSIAREELSQFLPDSVIKDLMGNQSPISPLKASPLSKNLPKVDMTNSPQIPPLESRLHGYLLGQNSKKREVSQLNLTDLFNTLEIKNEIEREIETMSPNSTIFSALEREKVFDQAEREIQMLMKSN